MPLESDKEDQRDVSSLVTSYGAAAAILVLSLLFFFYFYEDYGF
jgi:hypothetical protein